MRNVGDMSTFRTPPMRGQTIVSMVLDRPLSISQNLRYDGPNH